MSTDAETRIGTRILHDLRQRIITGRYAPGDRLPPRASLVAEYETTPVTMQRVCDVLAREGFLVAQGRHGTFVNERPPHLTVYGLVFPYRNRPERPWPRFWSALADEAGRMAEANGRSLVFSYGNETHLDREAYCQLEQDVLSSRLAGLIFASPPTYMVGSPVLEASGVPRVAIMNNPYIAGLPVVRLDGGLLEHLLDQVLATGRRRIAVVTTPQHRETVLKAARRRRLDIPSHWVQAVHVDAPESAREVVQLLMSLPLAERPDGLVITDDNLVTPATSGLSADAVASGLQVAVHCNFPLPAPAAVPVIRAGYDMSSLLNICVRLLDDQRMGREAPQVTRLPFIAGMEWQSKTGEGDR